MKRHAAAEATLQVLSRGIVGYVSYLAACRTSTVHTEHLLYEPILRIGQAQGYTVRSEFAVDMSQVRTEERDEQWHLAGDKKRIDFDFRPNVRKKTRFGIEVKWARAYTLNVREDVLKLDAYTAETDRPGYLLIFGKQRCLERLTLKGMKGLNSQKHLLTWKGSKTKFAARWYHVF